MAQQIATVVLLRVTLNSVITSTDICQFLVILYTRFQIQSSDVLYDSCVFHQYIVCIFVYFTRSH
ncbi:hypothetical protein EDB19DRAFT_1802545 [Suillus lakei]|nr:hypothetical protein EDB19DRAFT_1802545 [Suillus lakei]